jgi:hypothetical protein
LPKAHSSLNFDISNAAGMILAGIYLKGAKILIYTE